MIKSYKDLKVYQKSYKLALEIHNLTKNLPKNEEYEMGRQMRKAAISIPANIAEGYGKKASTAEFKRFLYISLGSCNELTVYINICRDLEYVEKDVALKFSKRFEVLGKQLNTMIEKWV